MSARRSDRLWPSVVYVIVVEDRNELGHICETVVSAFFDEDLAEAFCARFNENPETSPKSADVRPVGVRRSLPVRDTFRPGSKQGRAQKLSAEDVMSIRQRHLAGTTGKALAAEYGVTPATVYDVISGRSWGWL
jgi:hypothetical protein